MILEVVIGLAVVAAIMGKAYGTAPTVIFMICGLAATYTGYNMLRMFSSLRDPTLEIQGRVHDEDREALEYEKRLILQGIKELEVDFGVGKVDPRDYEMLKLTAEQRAIEIISRLREDDARWTKKAEALVSAKVPGVVDGPAAPAAVAPAAVAPVPYPEPTADEAPAAASADGLFDDRTAVWHVSGDRMICSACGAENDADGRFCQSCGRPRASEAA